MRILLTIVMSVAIGCSSEADRLPVPKPSQPVTEGTPTAPTDAITDSTGDTEKPAMREELFQFIQSPDRDSYLAFRRRLIESDAYEPYSDEIDSAGKLYEEEKIEEALETVQNAMPNLMLSPRAHRLLGFLHHKLGDEKAAQMEMMIGHACIHGILASGDGSEDRPYIVTRTSDEYDVIEHLGKQLKQQSLRHTADLHLDLIECTDGSVYWFDITDAYNQLTSSFGE